MTNRTLSSEDIAISAWEAADVPQMAQIWNEVVRDGVAFPQEEELDAATGAEFFAAQTYCGVARRNGEALGLYILHPNNIGRCGHIANASYAVAKTWRGHGIGEKLVRDSLAMGAKLGFGVLQFNAVAQSNFAAHKLYRKLGFQPLGVVPGGFRNIAGELEDICLYYHTL